MDVFVQFVEVERARVELGAHLLQPGHDAFRLGAREYPGRLQPTRPGDASCDVLGVQALIKIQAGVEALRQRVGVFFESATPQ